ncbi:MAG: hypothetical protein ABIR32_21750, partial [Ilumatobacteraceae bacterium]
SDGRLQIVEVADVGVEALLIHDAHREDSSLAFALARLSNEAAQATGSWGPTPFGVFRDVDRPDYGSMVGAQLVAAATKQRRPDSSDESGSAENGRDDLRALLRSAGTWQVG